MSRSRLPGLVLALSLGLAGCATATGRPLVGPSDPASSGSSGSTSATSGSAPAGSDGRQRSPGSGTGAGFSVVVVQSAEHTDDGSDDPPLTPTGTARAQRLAQLLASDPGVAVFVNQYQRSQSTGLPTARAWNVAPSLYDTDHSAAQVVAGVRAEYRTGEILLVGQHDNVTALVRALCACTVEPVPADDFATVFRIDFDAATGRASVQRRSGY